MGHLNINSLPNKSVIMSTVANALDSSFPDAQFFYKGFSKHYRKDRTLGGGLMQLHPKGVILIPFKNLGGGGQYGDPSSFKEGHLVVQKNHTLRKIRWCKCIR